MEMMKGNWDYKEKFPVDAQHVVPKMINITAQSRFMQLSCFLPVNWKSPGIKKSPKARTKEPKMSLENKNDQSFGYLFSGLASLSAPDE